MILQEGSFPLPGAEGRMMDVKYLNAHSEGPTPKGPLRYLHLVRAPHVQGTPGLAPLVSLAEGEYFRHLNGFTDFYHAWAEAQQIDLIVSPPSSRHDACPYREAIRRALPGVKDVTTHFCRKEPMRAGHAGRTLAEVIDAMTMRDAPDLSKFKSIAIIDDVLNTGQTVAAVLHHLHRNGLPDNSQIAVCAPLWIKVNR